MINRLDAFHEFFVATASVIGALIGLLFVAITVSQDRAARARSIDHRQRLRAAAAFTAFSNVLTSCLFGLIPGLDFGETMTAIGSVGLVFTAGAALTFRRYRLSWALAQDAAFLLGLVTIFALEVTAGVHLQHDPSNTAALQQVATLLIVCSLLGIARAWELVDAPRLSLGGQVADLRRDIAQEVRNLHEPHNAADGDTADGTKSADGDPSPPRTLDSSDPKGPTCG